MKKVWIHKKGNQSCIIYFSGWAMDEKAVNHLDVGDFDICLFHEYYSIHPIDENLKDYETIYLVAWSLGVWVAALALRKSQINITKSVALNGTLRPIHIAHGIAPTVFQTTLDSWNDKNRKKFQMRMFGGLKQFSRLHHRSSTKEIESQKNELGSIQNHIALNKKLDYKYDCALIGMSDMIFKADNQVSYWKSKTGTRTILKEIPHYPFANFETWNQIIEI